MAYVPDFTLEGKDHLLLLLNEENEKSYTFNEIIFDPPQVEIGGANTSVIVRANPGEGYKGSEKIFYNRLNLNTLFTGTLNLAMNEPASLQDILDEVLIQYGINITDDDVELVQDQFDNNVLQSIPTSYLCFGSVNVVWVASEEPEEPEEPLLQMHGYNNIALTGYDGVPLTFYAAV